MTEIEFDNEVLPKIHIIQLEMMDDILDFLEAHQVHYYLAYGTFLGAVRHKGFIPWDDDVDIHFLHEDYRRFLRLYKEQFDPERYCFQNSDDVCNYKLFSRIRKLGTYCPTGHSSGIAEEEGVWIDFFEVVDAARIECLLSFQTKLIWTIQKTKWLYMSENGSSQLVVFAKKACNRCIKAYIRLLYSLVLLLGHIGKPVECINMGAGFYKPATVSRLRSGGVIFPRAVFSGRKEYEFEGRRFYGPADYDTYLTAFYSSDYMTPQKTHVQVTDFSKVVL